MTSIPSWFLNFFNSTLTTPGATSAGAPADVGVAVTASTATLSLGETVTFTVTATDNGPGDAAGVSISVPSFGPLAIGTITPSSGTTYDSSSNTWSISTLPDGTSATLSVVTTVTGGGAAALAAEILGESSTDPVATNNLATLALVAAPPTSQPVQTATSSSGTNIPAATAGDYNTEVLTPTASNAVYALQSGYSAAYLAGTAAATLIDSTQGNAVLAGGGTSCTLLTTTSNDTLMAGAGNSFLVSFNGPAVMTAQGQGGNNTFWGSSAPITVQGGSGHDTTVALQGGVINTGTAGSQVWLGSGTATVNSYGADTIVGSAGSETINVLSNSGVLAFGGTSTGRMVFNGGAGVSTVVGFAGSVTVNAGTGGGTFFGGTAGNNVINNGGGSAVFFGGGNGDVMTATGSTTVTMAASSGAETMNGAGNSGTNVFFGGFGNDVMTGGTGVNVETAGIGNMTLTGGGTTDLFVFLDGAKNTSTITDFKASNDFVNLSTYSISGAAGLADVTDGSAGAVLNLPDGTQVTFANVAKSSLSAGNFI